MNYCNDTKQRLIDDEIYAKVKNFFKEYHKVIRYFKTGKLFDGTENWYRPI